MITELTQEQEAQLSEYRDRWVSIGLSTERSDRAAAERAMAKVYAAADLPAPEVLWAESPAGALALAASRGLGEPSEVFSNVVYGNQECSWLGFFQYFREVCGLVAETEPLVGMMELALHAGWFLPFDGLAIISERPTLIRRDEEGRLHALDGPAVAYADGWCRYCVHGEVVPAETIERREDASTDGE